jgi:hypothetical protein
MYKYNREIIILYLQNSKIKIKYFSSRGPQPTLAFLRKTTWFYD